MLNSMTKDTYLYGRRFVNIGKSKPDNMKLCSSFIFLVVFVTKVIGYPDPGKWQITLDTINTTLQVPKSLFNGSQIFIQISCKSKTPGAEVSISWSLTESMCWGDYFSANNRISPQNLYEHKDNNTITSYITPTNYPCDGSIVLPTIKLQDKKDSTVPKTQALPQEDSPADNINSVKEKAHPKEGEHHPVMTINHDGFYLLILQIDGTDFRANVEVEMMGKYGYLSAVDWPLLPFYAVMCGVYIVLGIIWLIACAWRWQDLLRIQFWIGGVIFLGMLEKAVFYAEYSNINKSGDVARSAVLTAEWVSCAKRTLARMLVIIVNWGFGITKPRLGPMLHRVVGVGGCYFVLACAESYIRVMPPSSNTSNKLLIASIPLAALDSVICWWILTALVETMRNLRLRRNLVKLNLYRHFTNTLIFNVLASIVFMLYTIKTHRLTPCLSDWKELWVEDAFWHILFSLILLVIMVLWRPTNNNQRYAFTPLLDHPEDDDEEEERFFNDAHGVKMRSISRAGSPKLRQTSEDDEMLKWISDNIPSGGVEAAMAIVDTDEEEITTQFEISKMN